MEKELKQSVIQKIMDRAIEINKGCEELCRDFNIMTSPLHKETLILRWTTIDLSDVDKPIQCYYYECFALDGTAHHCSIYYGNQEEANKFFWSLETHYQQDFSIDHKTRSACTK